MKPDLEVGVFGLRTFHVEELSGTLLPVNLPMEWHARRDYFHTWEGGTCVAKCWFNPEHQPPEPGCTCGIYCIRDLTNLRGQYQQANGLVAVVALEGRVIEGELGWRAQAGRVVALWSAPGVITAQVRKRINRQVPGLTWLTSDGQVTTYPGLADQPRASDPSSPVRDALRRSIVFASPTMAWGDLSEMRFAMRVLRSLLW